MCLGLEHGVKCEPGRYLVPANAGLASTPRAVGRRAGKLLDALDTLLSTWTATGGLVEELWRFKAHIIEALNADEWTVRAGEDDRYHVTAPKAKGGR